MDVTSTDTVKPILSTGFVKQERVLKSPIEMAFEEHTCSPLSLSRHDPHGSCRSFFHPSGSPGQLCVCEPSTAFRSLIF